MPRDTSFQSSLTANNVMQCNTIRAIQFLKDGFDPRYIAIENRLLSKIDNEQLLPIDAHAFAIKGALQDRISLYTRQPISHLTIENINCWPYEECLSPSCRRLQFYGYHDEDNQQHVKKHTVSLESGTKVPFFFVYDSLDCDTFFGIPSSETPFHILTELCLRGSLVSQLFWSHGVIEDIRSYTNGWYYMYDWEFTNNRKKMGNGYAHAVVVIGYGITTLCKIPGAVYKLKRNRPGWCSTIINLDTMKVGYWIVRNCFGLNIGKNGYFFIPWWRPSLCLNGIIGCDHTIQEYSVYTSIDHADPMIVHKTLSQGGDDGGHNITDEKQCMLPITEYNPITMGFFGGMIIVHPSMSAIQYWSRQRYVPLFARCEFYSDRTKTGGNLTDIKKTNDTIIVTSTTNNISINSTTGFHENSEMSTCMNVPVASSSSSGIKDISPSSITSSTVKTCPKLSTMVLWCLYSIFVMFGVMFVCIIMFL
jgi:Papain family cysteine protease